MMNRVKSFISSRIEFALFISAVMLFISVFLFRPFWEENDDIWITLLTEGALGKQESHILFSNIIYGNILCALQNIIPGLRWHAVLEYLFAFIITVEFVYYLDGDKKGRILSVGLLLCCHYEIFVAMQFSKIPAYIAILGYMILFGIASHEEMPERPKRIMCVIVWICMFYAIILRSDSFLLATMIAGLYGIIRVVFEIKNGIFRKRFSRYCICFVPVFVIWIMCFGVDRIGYSDEEWGDFHSYQYLESAMVDKYYGALIYDDHADELEAIGVSENDAFMFLTWQFADDDYLTPDLIRDIIAIEPKGFGSVDVDMMKGWIANIYETICVLNPVVIGVVAVLGIFTAYVLAGTDGVCNALILIVQLIAAAGVLFYFQYSGRWSHRIVYALLITLLILFIYLLYENREFFPDTVVSRCILVLLLFTIATQRLGNEFAYQDYKRNECDYPEVVSYMTNNKDKLFVGDTFTMQGYDKYNVFKASDKGQFDNYVTVGGAYVNSPVTKSITEAFGYTNPFKALEGRDENVILMDNNYPERKINYCNEHGDGREYSLEEWDTIGNINMYRIR